MNTLFQKNYDGVRPLAYTMRPKTLGEYVGSLFLLDTFKFELISQISMNVFDKNYNLYHKNRHHHFDYHVLITSFSKINKIVDSCFSNMMCY